MNSFVFQNTKYVWYLPSVRQLCRLHVQTFDRGLTHRCLQNNHVQVRHVNMKAQKGKPPLGKPLKQPIRNKPAKRLEFYKEGGHVLLIFPLTCVYLVTWQLKRLKWKKDLIKELETSFALDPVPLPENLEDLEKLQYHRMTVRGEYDYSHEVYIGPRSQVIEDSADLPKTAIGEQRVPGVHVITPFKLADRNVTIMINRGYVPNHRFSDDAHMEKGKVHGVIDVTGYVRLEQPWRNIWYLDPTTPSIVNGRKLFLSRNMEVLSKELGTAPVFLDAEHGKMNQWAPNGLLPTTDLPNNHLQYAYTWGLLGLVTFYFWIRRFQRPSSPAAIHRYLEKEDMMRMKKPK